MEDKQQAKWEERRQHMEVLANNGTGSGWDHYFQIKRAIEYAKQFHLDPDFPGFTIHFSDKKHPWKNKVYLGVVRLPGFRGLQRVLVDSEGVSESESMVKKVKRENRLNLEAIGWRFEVDDREREIMCKGSEKSTALTGSSFSNPVIRVIPGKMAEHRNRAWG